MDGFIEGASLFKSYAQLSVHFFSRGDHQVMHIVSDVGPATVVLDAVGAATIPLDHRRPQDAKLRIRRCRTVGRGQKNRSVELAVATALLSHHSLTDDQNQTIKTGLSRDVQRSCDDQDSGSGIRTEVEIATHVCDLGSRIRAV